MDKETQTMQVTTRNGADNWFFSFAANALMIVIIAGIIENRKATWLLLPLGVALTLGFVSLWLLVVQRFVLSSQTLLVQNGRHELVFNRGDVEEFTIRGKFRPTVWLKTSSLEMPISCSGGTIHSKRCLKDLEHWRLR